MEHLLQGLLKAKSSSELFYSSLNLIYKKYKPNHCFIADTNRDDSIAYTNCYLQEGRLVENFSYPLLETPCDIALKGLSNYCFYSSDIQKKFPKDIALEVLGAQAYIGLPLTARNGERVGLVVMLYDRAMPNLELDNQLIEQLGYILGQELYQNKLNQNNQRLIRQFEHVESLSDLGFFQWDIQRQTFEFSPNFWRVLAVDPYQLPSLEFLFSTYIFADSERASEYIATVLSNLDNPSVAIVSKDESPVNKHLKLICHNNFDEQGVLTSIEWVIQNITLHQELTHEFNMACEALNQSNDAILITDAENKIVQLNDRVEELTGYCREELMGKNPSLFSSGLQEPDFYKKMWADLESNGRWEGELWNKTCHGTIFPERLSIATLKDENRAISHYIAVFRDITRRKNNEKKIEQYQKYEFVTGLKNRQIFIQDIEDRLLSGEKISVALFDIKGFSLINQIHGDEIGDQLLSSVAERLGQVMGEQCIAACRYGSDEFAIIIDEMPIEYVLSLCKDIRRELLVSYSILGRTISIGWNVGVSTTLNNVSEANPMMQAKLALEKSKIRDGQPVVYTSELEDQSVRRLKLKVALEAAIKEKHIQVYYQPIYHTESKVVKKFEALARWKHGNEYISPFEFIGIAEEYDLIIPLGRCILDQACADLVTLHNQGYTDTVFSINRSIKELNAVELQHNSIIEVLNHYQLPVSAIVVEITESVSLDDNPIAKQVIDKLKQSGIKLAIDDFGTGYASFGNLLSQELDYLKIDRSFIKDIMHDKGCSILTQTAISLAEKLDLDVIAEGVETESQLTLLKGLGCKFVQGYFLGKPAPFQDIYRHLPSL